VNEHRLRGRRVLVTGAASGIGRATCRRLAAEGAAIGALDLDAADEGDARVRADVSDATAVGHAVDELAAALDGLDGLVNAAGIGSFTGDVGATDPEQWARVIAVDLTGPYLVSRAVLPHLRAAGGGAIVHVSSQYGLTGCADSPAYVAAKAGLIGLTRAMAVDHAPEQIRVTCICPGPVNTPMLTRAGAQESEYTRERDRVRGRVLLDRIAEPDEIAATIAFLLSPDAAYLTGTILPVDGGWSAG
jgi:NAD(P)-dependent dehydrogenase (short-subunit alcohol dehydrogenase family)